MHAIPETNSSATPQQREKSAQLLWTVIILGFFLIQAIIWTIAISITSNDPSHAVVSNYDEKALRWDEWRALQQASAKLGWVHELAVDDQADERDVRAVTLTLRDAQGLPIDGATVALSSFHCGHAGEKQELAFQSLGDGIYASALQVRYAGKWQFEGAVTVGESTYLIEERQRIKIEKKKR